MPATIWAVKPTIAPHGYGFTIPVGVISVDVPESEDMPAATRWEGVGVEVRSLAAVDISAGISADPDANESHLDEALAGAQAETAPTIQPQLDGLLDGINRTALTAEGVTLGQQWRPPTGAHDAYPKGWQVTENGKTWESLTPANVWAPGTSGWREVVQQGDAPAAWVQPTGEHDAYAKGAQVTFEKSVYESLIDANTWSPTGYPSGWKKL